MILHRAILQNRKYVELFHVAFFRVSYLTKTHLFEAHLQPHAFVLAYEHHHLISVQEKILPDLGFGDQGTGVGDHTEEGDLEPEASLENGDNSEVGLESEFSPGASLESEVPLGAIFEVRVPSGASLEYEVSVLAVEDGETDKAGFLQL